MSFHQARRQFLHGSMTGAGALTLLDLLKRDLRGAVALTAPCCSADFHRESPHRKNRVWQPGS